VHWSIPDPVAEGDTDDETYPAFRRTAEDLEERIGALLAQMSEDKRQGGGHAR
jgi:ArsR family transcriptional regulator, arsenate/arsenite/antimonite-responsive transcriptional repressor / arsenate reductase (thioredoxin)